MGCRVSKSSAATSSSLDTATGIMARRNSDDVDYKARLEHKLYLVNLIIIHF